MNIASLLIHQPWHRPVATCMLLLSFLVGSSLFGQDPVISAHAKLENRMNRFMQQLHQDSDFPGGSISLVLPDNSIVTATVGLASLESKQAITPTSKFMSGSIGKTYFAAMAIDLMLQNKLSLDQKVAACLDDDKSLNRIANFDEISVAHLMRHQSGLPRYIENRQVWTDVVQEPNKSWTPGEQLSYIFDQKPVHAPGKGWAYSDTNYILLAMVLEKIAAEQAYRYIRTRYLEPHQLANTQPNNQRELPGLVQGYTHIFRPLGIPKLVIQDGKFVFNPAMEWGGGGYLSNTEDLARWGRLLFAGELFAGAYVDQMLADAVPAAMLGPETSYGLGVMIRKTEQGISLGHDGVFPGYTSTMAYYPERKIAAALMINSDGPAVSKPLHTILNQAVTIATEELTKD